MEVEKELKLKESKETLVLAFESFSVLPNEFAVTFSRDGIPFTRTFKSNVTIQKVKPETLRNIVFHLGLFCLMDFDQLLVPKKIRIHCGKLDSEQKDFYLHVRDLYARQLFFERRASMSILTRDIESSGETFKADDTPLDPEQMVGAFGGGKESILYKLILESNNVKPLWFVRTRMLFKNALHTIAHESGIDGFVSIDEDIDLYQNGYIHKGTHSRTNTGISLYIMFMIMFALENNRGNICLGNERSSDDPYCFWDGVVVNHQFDKTAEFRRLLQDYIHRNISSSINLFSIFESFYEYKLAKMISKFPVENFRHMTSCNYLTDAKKWCHKCPKCAWTFSILSYAFGIEEATQIVGKNLFEDIEIYKPLLDPNVHKPFECVGERPEVWLILYHCWIKGQRGAVIKYFTDEYLPGLQPSLKAFEKKYEKSRENRALPAVLKNVFRDFADV